MNRIYSKQQSLIMLKNPHHSSLPIRSVAAPHYPTRRPALGTLMTLPSRVRDRYKATVVAIEQNHWPREWTYMIRVEESVKSPELLMTILDRGPLNSQDNSIRIRPKAAMLTDGDVPLFFDAFEHPTRMTIIQKVSSDFYETVRMVTSSQAQRSPRMKSQVTASHRLFTANTPPSDTAKLSDVTQPGQTLKSTVNWGPKITWHASPDIRDDTANHQGPPPEKLTVSEGNSQPEVDHLEATELAEGWAATASADRERKLLSIERRTVVIPKKRRLEGHRD